MMAIKSQLVKEGKKLAIPDDDDNLADFNYIKHFVFDIDARRLNFSNISNRELGEQYGLVLPARRRAVLASSGVQKAGRHLRKSGGEADRQPASAVGGVQWIISRLNI